MSQLELSITKVTFGIRSQFVDSKQATPPPLFLAAQQRTSAIYVTPDPRRN
jgi:hypothetical protein